MKRLRALLIALTVVAALSAAAASPSLAQGYVYADCAVGITDLQQPGISCADVVGGEARGRADCAWAPDTYTGWVTSYQSDVGGACWWSARGTILETRAY